MGSTITQGATTITPTLVLGSGSPSVTFGSTGLRTGTLQILCASKAQAAAVEALHALAGVFVFADTDVAILNMHYVPSGDISMELNDERESWTVSIDFQEVSA